MTGVDDEEEDENDRTNGMNSNYKTSGLDDRSNYTTAALDDAIEEEIMTVKMTLSRHPTQPLKSI